MRFGVLIPQDAPFDELLRRWRLAEELGFDAAYVADHTADHRDVGGYWLDGWTVLAHVAANTKRIRVGTLVSNPLLRHPAQLAKQAAAVDVLSAGRLELGIGTGIAGFDHDAIGVEYWSPRERAARFAEYVAVVAGLTAAPGCSFEFSGRYVRTSGAALNPPPVQQPRFPITLGGQSPTVRRTAVRYADCWNTHGPYDRTLDDIAELTARQNQEMDELCAAAGRNPGTLRRSLLLFGVLDAWAAADHFERVVHRFTRAGMHEFVVFWPPDDRISWLEKTAELMQSMR